MGKMGVFFLLTLLNPVIECRGVILVVIGLLCVWCGFSIAMEYGSGFISGSENPEVGLFHRIVGGGVVLYKFVFVIMIAIFLPDIEAHLIYTSEIQQKNRYLLIINNK